MSDPKNFSCDIETGVCAPSGEGILEEIHLNKPQKVQLIYYTDPICSACWAIEPELKKFKLEYGDYVDIEYKMGGLLPGWEGFADKANGIGQPSDVAPHWDEVGEHTGMSIDGDVWLEDPLSSSFPPSIAFKAMQKQGEEKALDFLRRIREMVFLEKKNITKEPVLLKAVEDCDGDKAQFQTDYHSEQVKQSFHSEMLAGRQMGVRGFPTFIFVGTEGTGFKISGMSGYANYELALERTVGYKVNPQPIPFNELELLKKYRYLATKEIAFVLDQNEAETLSALNKLEQQGLVQKVKQKYAFFWRIVD
ncbi:DsbA family protein [Rapidithrix thailandica]|uniref:DsbA family protein n=1 Tax=Rapidithrix thailandica TaxID=413964 RepID=A0AAW9SGZ5_9BACT